AGKFFDQDLLVGKIKRQKTKEKFVIKSAGNNIFRGKLALLIDSDTASAAEIFARVAQIEKRGLVLGDRSAGAVMQATQFLHRFGINPEAPYYVQITIADLTMRDGQRLEKKGVTPDETILPSPSDIATRRDPVLSRAAETLGFKLSPENAGQIFTKQ
ncbi:MAG: S41 family peptidase, partial [bacterium]|nr:S41 family peptidase [bacterium]